jgi:predicted enzyme related to lactoylglutathione lyase
MVGIGAHWLLAVARAFLLGAACGGLAMAAAAKGTPKGTVTGIGGVFLRAKDPAKLGAWYRDHLGIDAGKEGKIFVWREDDAPEKRGQTIWSLFPEKTKYFGSASQQTMINYRIDDLDALLARLKAEGIEPVKAPETHDYGKFAWIEDGEGNRIELWEPRG